MIPQREALYLQLAAIAGNEPASSFLEIRWKAERGMVQEFVPVRELDRAVEVTLGHGQLSDTYSGAAPRVRESGSQGDVERS